MTGRYRIVWARIDCGYGRERMCLAERRVTIPHTGLGFWWPVANGAWRHTEAEAERDIAGDRRLRAPLPPDRIIEP